MLRNRYNLFIMDDPQDFTIHALHALQRLGFLGIGLTPEKSWESDLPEKDWKNICALLDKKSIAQLSSTCNTLQALLVKKKSPVKHFDNVDYSSLDEGLFARLPNEVILLIFQFLKGESALPLSMTCKMLGLIANNAGIREGLFIEIDAKSKIAWLKQIKNEIDVRLGKLHREIGFYIQMDHTPEERERAIQLWEEPEVDNQWRFDVD